MWTPVCQGVALLPWVDMGGCQNNGPPWGPLNKYEVPYYIKDPKCNQNFGNHPYATVGHGTSVRVCFLGFGSINCPCCCSASPLDCWTVQSSS